MAVRRRKRKAAKKRPVPTNPVLYARVKAEAKRRFKVYPSAYANGWLVRTYKARGGRYRMGTGRKEEKMIDYIKNKFIQLWNIISGKDKNWDGSVDIKDKMIEAEEKAQNG